MKKIPGGIFIGAVTLCLIVSAFFIFWNSQKEAPDTFGKNMNTETPKQNKSTIVYTLPEESEPHEGTWLEWPHQYQYGIEYRDSLDATWVAMTKALETSERVHIAAYDENEKVRITELLKKANVSLENVDFKVYPNDDVWMRDNGPIYVRDTEGKLVIQDWGFNGWGKKEGYLLSDTVPAKIAQDQNIPLVDLNSIMINEGGAVEVDGDGTLMATRSSILNENRNPGMTQPEAESIFNKYLGIENFIWLDGKAGLEITDMHIDGFARFGNKETIVTMSKVDLLEWEVPEQDIETLRAAKNKEGKIYNFLTVPLTQKNVVTEDGRALGYRGSYINYYIANTVVLVPNYNDPKDTEANDIIQKLYPTRKVIGIDVRNLYENGGMVHCVTQQQPKE
jgi:agmatine deiminase